MDTSTVGNNNSGEETEYDLDQVIKNGPLFIPYSKPGFCWRYSWRKRWFVLTLRAFIFFKRDPSMQEAGAEVNIILGGFLLKNSGRVTVREDKRILTAVLSDGSSFTVKAETSEDFREWRTALEYAVKRALK